MNTPTIQIDKTAGLPVYLQLAERIRLLVREGELRIGDPMPTVRGLAVELGVNANTVARVYRELQSEGLLRLERGVGTFVAEGAGAPMKRADLRAIEKAADKIIDLAHGAGMNAFELSQFIETRWKEVRRVQR